MSDPTNYSLVVPAGYNYQNITTSAQTQVKVGGGWLGGVVLNTTLVSAVRLYDNTVSGTPIIATIPALATAGNFYKYEARLNTGLVVSSGAAADNITVLYL